jgi:hypothetical protein
VYAIKNKCSHLNLPLQGKVVGKPLAGECIVCPFHGTKYNVKTGAVEGDWAPGALPRHSAYANLLGKCACMVQICTGVFVSPFGLMAMAPKPPCSISMHAAPLQTCLIAAFLFDPLISIATGMGCHVQPPCTASLCACGACMAALMRLKSVP